MFGHLLGRFGLLTPASVQAAARACFDTKR